MELADDTLRGLANLQDRAALPDDVFQQVLENVISQISKSTVDSGTIKCESKQIEYKSAFANVTCLFVEAARRNLDQEALEVFLTNTKIFGHRVKKLCELYDCNKKAIQAQLESIGYGSPHIVDIDWRLDYCIKVDTCNSVGVPLYRVRFTTRKHEVGKNVTFTCTIQQLQDLVSKLKDAVRHIEKLTNV